jgi:tetratricopeptide (TPR) repeat protein
MAYLKLGQPDQALVDYDEALKLRPNPAALYGRGVAKLMKGDIAASNADFEVAKEIKPSIAEEFTKVGVQAKPKSFF